MLSVTSKLLMLSVIMLNVVVPSVIILSVVAPSASYGKIDSVKYYGGRCIGLSIWERRWHTKCDKESFAARRVYPDSLSETGRESGQAAKREREGVREWRQRRSL